MSSYDYGFGVTEQDREKMKQIRALRARHGELSIPPIYDDRPGHPTIDGEKHVVELRGANRTKVHRDDPGLEDPTPWCMEKAGGYDRGASVRGFKYQRLSVAKDWREPCSVCFPEGYDE